MERLEWLKKMRSMAENAYDHFAPLYWVTYGMDEYKTHQEYLQKFLGRVASGGALLSAGCGAGRWDGILLEAGHSVVGIDQSAGMLQRAREHFPQERFPGLRYEKMGLQEMQFQEAFAGAICVDALEHICPEDYPRILRKLQEALKPDGMLYFTVDNTPSADLGEAFERARRQGLPVVFGELVDRVEDSYTQTLAMGQTPPGDLGDSAVYHYYPPLEQVRTWLDQVGFSLEAEGSGDGYAHFVARKK